MLAFFRSRPIHFFSTKPWRRLKQGVALLRHWVQHREVSEVLALPTIKLLVQKEPIIRYKYLGDYLSDTFTLAERRQCIVDHYQYIQAHLPPPLLMQLPDGLILWRGLGKATEQWVKLDLAQRSWIEGDLALNYYTHGQEVYRLTFSIFRGQILNIPQAFVLFVGGIQGKPGCIHLLKEAAKLNDEVFPPVLLLVVLQAIGQFLGITSIAGIAAQAQHAYTKKKELPETLVEKYDRFWLDNGGEQHNEKVFCLSTQLQEYAPGGNRHNGRRRRRLHFKAQVIQGVITNLQSIANQTQLPQVSGNQVKNSHNTQLNYSARQFIAIDDQLTRRHEDGQQMLSESTTNI